MINLSPTSIIERIKASNLIGRGGAGYPTGVKWERMKQAQHAKMYIVVNGSEGEPGTMKDGYILKNHLDELIDGITAAYSVFPNTLKIYVYLRKDYFDTYRKAIEEKGKKLPLVVFREPGGYLCGENTVLINSIEGKRFEPRRKPPYCSEVGLWGLPTLVNNLETFFRISQIVKNVYKETRYYSLNGELDHQGVFDLPVDITIEEVLQKTKNFMTKDHFVQVGGGASGKYFLFEEIRTQKANLGTGTIIVYNAKMRTLIDLMEEKLAFLLAENCGKCTPCREGVFRLIELVKEGKIEEQEAIDVIDNMLQASFCGLGEGAGDSFASLWSKKDRIWNK